MTVKGRPQTLVPTTRVVEHIALLRRSGLGMYRIAELAGVSRPTLYHLVSSTTARRQDTVTADTEARVLAIRPSLSLVARHRLVEATGTRRRVEALMAIGWSSLRIAAHAGVTPTVISSIHRAERCELGTALAVRATYDALWDQVPPQRNRGEKAGYTRARNRATAEGWVSPLAWDDDAIDDPAAVPDLGAPSPRRLPQAERVAELEHLLAQGVSRELAARRCGFSSWDSASSVLSRAGRAAA